LFRRGQISTPYFLCLAVEAWSELWRQPFRGVGKFLQMDEAPMKALAVSLNKDH
jgi:hypothetical protein